jgi:heptosyltransferase-2
MIKPIVRFRAWQKQVPPKKILVMRFQAIGDVIITLPYLQDLKNKFPNTEIHFLTRKETGDIPKQLKMFTRVIEIGGKRSAKLQFLICLFGLPMLWLQRYDAVVDLQNHRISRILRKLIGIKVWSEFDRSSPVSAGERTGATINSLGFGSIDIASKIQRMPCALAEQKLRSGGWDGSSAIIILNPAGAFETRAWPIQNYVKFAMFWLEREPKIQFLIAGLPSLVPKAEELKKCLGSRLIDITGKTTLFEAFTIVQRAKLVLSEDSGLMHMAWTQRVPTLALLGSTRNDWSAPLGEWSRCLNSSDLVCGNCMQEKCKFNDTHCLTRYTAKFVFRESRRLLEVLSPETEKLQSDDLPTG